MDLRELKALSVYVDGLWQSLKTLTAPAGSDADVASVVPRGDVTYFGPDPWNYAGMKQLAQQFVSSALQFMGAASGQVGGVALDAVYLQQAVDRTNARLNLLADQGYLRKSEIAAAWQGFKEGLASGGTKLGLLLAAIVLLLAFGRR